MSESMRHSLGGSGGSVRRAPDISRASLVCGALAGAALVVCAVASLFAIDVPAGRTLGTETTAVRSFRFLAGDDWNERIRGEDYWRGGSRNRGGSQAAPATKASRSSVGLFPFSDGESMGWGEQPGRQPAPPAARAPRSGAFRTVCVRLCDGFFYPIGFATGSDDLGADAAKCQQSCSSPARLYVHRSPGEDMNELVDLQGQPYSKLKTANLFRKSYDEACKCKPHPWEQASLDRHRVYALEAKRKKGDAAAIAELDRLKAKAREAKLEAQLAAKQSRKAKRGGTPAAVAAAAPSVVGQPDLTPATASVAPAANIAAVRAPAMPAQPFAPVPSQGPVQISGQPSAQSAGQTPAQPVAPPPVTVAGGGDTEPAVDEAPARPVHRHASIHREGVMRLSAPRRTEPAVAQQRAGGDWVRRAFSQN